MNRIVSPPAFANSHDAEDLTLPPTQETSDVDMAEMNGRDLSRLPRSEIPTLTRLFMSGYTDKVEQARP